jgi:hypothetical protein
MHKRGGSCFFLPAGISVLTSKEWNRNKLRFLTASFGLILRHKNLTLGQPSGAPLRRSPTTSPFLLLD